MLPNSSDSQPVETASASAVSPKLQRTYRWWLLIVVPAWVFASFMFAQVLLVGVIFGLRTLGVSFTLVNASVLNTVAAALTYVLSILIVVGVPWLLKKRLTSMKDIGLTRLPTWGDIGFAPVGFIVYVLASGALVFVATQIFPEFNAAQAQETGFDHLGQGFEYLLAFATLVVVAPFAEEILFRGYLYGKLRKAVPVWLAMIVTSVLFGAVHGQWNVGLDVFVLSMVACCLREVTDNIWAGVLLHMLKNGLAFYVIFVNPTLLIQ